MPIDVNCRYDVSPRPSCSVISQTGRALQLRDVTHLASGVYSCIATNDGGDSNNATADVQVNCRQSNVFSAPNDCAPVGWWGGVRVGLSCQLVQHCSISYLNMHTMLILFYLACSVRV